VCSLYGRKEEIVSLQRILDTWGLKGREDCKRIGLDISTEKTEVGRGMSGKGPIGNRAPPRKRFRVYRQPRSVEVTQEHLGGRKLIQKRPSLLRL
jgi:hypothetical protein